MGTPQIFIEEITIFQEVVRLGSMSAAAESLRLRQPAVSKAVKRLEEHWGGAILSRGREGSRPTVLGKSLLKAVHAAQEAMKTSQLTNSSQISRLRIGCHQSIGIEMLPKFIPLIEKRFPQAEIELQFAPSPEITRRVTCGELDIGFVVSHVKRRQLVVKTVGKDFIALWTCKSPKVTQKVLVHPDMLYLAALKKNMHEEILQVPDYEIIAHLVKDNPSMAALLPEVVAVRYGLQQLGKKILEVQLAAIVHEDRFERAFLRDLFSLVGPR